MVAFYPTRYDVGKVASQVGCPVAAFFAEYDVLPGATVDDAHDLREQLRENENVRENRPTKGTYMYIFCRVLINECEGKSER